MFKKILLAAVLVAGVSGLAFAQKPSAEMTELMGQAFTASDTNKDSKVTLVELTALGNKLLDALDLDRDGKLTKKEIRANLRIAIAMVDLNKDNAISKEELAKINPSLLLLQAQSK